jgi:Ca-activated chloride channel family protein
MERLARIVLSFGLLLALAGAAHAADPERPGSGVLEALGPDGEPLGACPLRHTAVSVEVAGFVSRVRVTQTFANPFPDPIEAIYAFPLSQKGAVDAMWIRTGEREIRGEIKRREEARRIYEAARERGQLAALLDQERPNIFTQRLANLMPGDEVEIVLEYVEPLAYRAGEFELVFPTVVGPRFIPGRPTGHSGTGWSPDTTRVPDASLITPPVTPEGTRAGHDLSIEVTIDAGVPIGAITSPLHAIDVKRRGEERARVTLQRQREIPNRDFVLRYAVAGDEIRSGFLVHRNGGEGYASFVILPPRRVAPREIAPRELVFVIDRSGSQRGRPLLKAKETLLWILERLRPQDTFQIVSFANRAEFLFEVPRPVNPESQRRAREYIHRLEANGGTMMAEAIREIASRPADGHRLRIVTFMTDGYVGNDFEILSLVRELRGTSRWFPFGTGNAVNRFLLEGMARYGGGEVEYVLLNEPGEAVARKFYARIEAPVLTDVELEFRGLDVYDVHPNRVADVWDERPLVIHARYGRSGRGQVILRGYRAGKAYRQAVDVTLPRRAKEGNAIASMWARARVNHLMAQDLAGLQSGEFPGALREAIVQVALEHRLLTQFTSFVAVEDRVVNENGVLRTVPVPVEMPQGVEYEGIFGDADERRPQAGLYSAPGSASFGKRALQYALEALPAPPPQAHRAPREELAVRRDGESSPLSERARRVLAPELRALLEGTAKPVAVPLVDGRVRVEVTLLEGATGMSEALRRAGLRIENTADGVVTGSIALEQLAWLAELDGITRIEAAPPLPARRAR